MVLTSSSSDQHGLHCGQACIINRKAWPYHHIRDMHFVLCCLQATLARWLWCLASADVENGSGGKMWDAKTPARSGGQSRLGQRTAGLSAGVVSGLSLVKREKVAKTAKARVQPSSAQLADL